MQITSSNQTVFYCTVHFQVTLVLAKPGSVANRLCQNCSLVPLRWRKRNDGNPFLFRSGGEFHVATSPNLVVEVLYTQDIDMNWIMSRGAQMKYQIPTIGRGFATPGGIPKNPDCEICNL